jgi:hypothetical protein
MKNIFYLCIVLLCIGCEKDPEPVRGGVETQVSGRIYDNINDLPLAGQKIKIAEYKTKYMNYGSVGSNEDFIGFIDSTYTDVSGNYDFIFKTTGNGNVYRVMYFETEDVRSYEEPFEIEKIGEPQHFDFFGLQLYPQDLKIITTDLSIVPVEIYVKGKPYIIPDLTESNVEVTRRIYVDKNSVYNVNFQRRKPDYSMQDFKLEFPATGTTEITQQNITIHDSDFVDRE